MKKCQGHDFGQNQNHLGSRIILQRWVDSQIFFKV